MEDGKLMINILYEDNHLLVVEKPINMPVQADKSGDVDLLNVLKKYLKDKYNKPGNVYLGLVHRLDRPVGGVMVFAKTSKAASRLSEQIKEHQFRKTYYAAVYGNLLPKSILIDTLHKDTVKNIVSIQPNGKKAILNYEVLATKNNWNLVKINLQTGRAHQIRVQFSSRGNALYGDQKYNSKAKPKQQLALFAKELTFSHPITKEEVTFNLPLPKRYPFTLFE